MYPIKIENFRKDFPNDNFPRFSTLSGEDCLKIRTNIAERLGLDLLDIDGVTLLRKLLSVAVRIPNYNAETDGFDLSSIFEHVGFTAPEKIYINWHHFDRVDGMRFSDLRKYFDHIWYPSSDDIDIFDDSLRWVIMVLHTGDIKYVSLQKP